MARRIGIAASVAGVVCAAGGCGSDQGAVQASAGGSAGQTADSAIGGGARVDGSGAADGTSGPAGAAGPVQICQPGQTLCGNVCVSLATDPANCGQCGSVCVAGQGCVGGACICPSGTALCGAACIDVTQDAFNCGGCNVLCQGGQLCQAGMCVCQPGLTDCFGACADLGSDGNNCGACSVVCQPGQVCSAGSCGTTCTIAGQTACGTSCVDLLSDPLNCGQCGVVCPTGQLCTQGVCSCPAGLIACSGQCVDVMTNPRHCGGCGIVCTAAQSCASGVCEGGPEGTGGTPGAGGTGGVVTAAGGTATGGTAVGGAGTAGVGAAGAPVATGGDGSGGEATGGLAGSGAEPTGGAAGAGGDAQGGAAGSAGAGTGGEGTGGESSSVCGVNSDLGTGVVQMEDLCRGVVAVRTGSGSFISWRLMGYEPDDIAFNVYRDGTQVNASPITDSTNYVDSGAPESATYTVRAVIGGVEQGDSSNTRTSTSPTSTWGQNYQTIPLNTTSGYSAGDTSVGDLDGDGEYELVVKEEQSPRDPSQDGTTGQPKFAAYELDGTFLWRVDLGVNIRESEHTTTFVVYDLDGDGSAELAVKTAPGTRDGTGAYLSNGPAANDDDGADYRNSAGRILSGPEYLTVFRGSDGAELATINYHAPYDSGDWGDNPNLSLDKTAIKCN